MKLIKTDTLATKELAGKNIKKESENLLEPEVLSTLNDLSK